MNSPVEKIKERLSIEDVVSSYIKLDGVGTNLKARCPFHNEKTPSFFVSPGRGSYYCFGCGASGDIFTFVEEFEGLDFKGALKVLADRAGVALESFTKEKAEDESEKEKLYRVMDEAVKYFEFNLNKHPEVLEYLHKRGLNEKSIKDFRIGFAELEWRNLFDHLKNKGFPEIIIEKAGLAKKPEDKSKAPYDRFRGRVMFPLADSSGRIIAFSGRLFIDDPSTSSGQVTNQPKYLNSPETPIFSKNRVLYGLDKAKDSIRKNNFSILVEGQMDLVLSHQAGYRNTVATSGTALSESTMSKENVVSNLGIVRRLSPNIVLAFDADKAGFNAANKAARIALSLGMDVKVADMGEGMDPADTISRNGVDAWKEVIRKSKHIIEFLLNKAVVKSSGDMRKVGRIIGESILPYVDALSSSIEKSHFIKKISDVSGIPESALQDDLKKIEQEFGQEKEEIKEVNLVMNNLQRKDYILRKLLGILFYIESLSIDNLDIKTTWLEIESTIKQEESMIRKKYDQNKNDLLFESEVFYGNLTEESRVSNLKKDISELLQNLKEESFKEDLESKMRELKSIEGSSGKDTKTLHLLQDISDLNNKIQNIKNSRRNN